MKFLFVLTLILFSSCIIFKNKKEIVVVKGKIEIHKPYCGGKFPTKEESKGFLEPYSNATFYVKKKMNNDPKLETVLTFKTDENGNYEFKIKKGSYIVIHEDKTLSFEDYVKKYNQKTNQFLEYIGDIPAKEVYQQADFSIDIQESKEFNYAYKTRCFVGLNPIMEYIGPAAQ